MMKFCLSDSKKVIASVKDPVALDCISKLAQDVIDNSAVSTDEQLDGDVIQALFQNSQHKPVNQEQTVPTDLDSLPSSANQDLSAVSLPTTTATTSPTDDGAAVLSQSVSTVSEQMSATSQIPLFISPHDLMSLPVITLPLVACTIANSGGITTLNQSASSDKSYIAVAAMAMDDISSLPENAVFKTTYGTL